MHLSPVAISMAVCLANQVGPVELREDGVQFGRALCAVDDLDGDGRSEIAVAAPCWPTREAADGRIFLLSGASGACLKTIDPPEPGKAFGDELLSWDDCDGDGVRELLVRSDLRSACRTWLVVSPVTGRPLRALAVEEDPDDEHLHWRRLVPVGDIDGDGSTDVAFARRACVSWLSGATGAELRRTHVGEALVLLGPAGDLDGDGIAEVVASRTPGPPTSVVVLGHDGDELAELELSGPATIATFLSGPVTAAMGDTDGDGTDDFALRFRRRGEGLDLFSGEDLERRITVTLPRRSERQGPLISGADFDQDGIADLILASSGHWMHGPSEVVALSGRDGTVLWKRSELRRMGTSLAWLPDVDGDGVPEVATGGCDHLYHGPRVYREGFVHLLSGRTGATLWVVDANTAPARCR